MIRAACHCGAVRFEISEPPSWVRDCNCTLCRRYGTLWSYYHDEDQAKLLKKPDVSSTATYTWGSQSIAFHFCKTCGCLTHAEARPPYEPLILSVNARMMVGLDPAHVRVIQSDNGHSGHFWTKSDQPVVVSHQPPPSPDDWR